MDKNKKLGQDPAFASQSQAYGGNTFNSKVQTGISKRLYIATKAMQGIISTNPITLNIPDIVRHSYDLADELLKQEDQE